MVHLLTFDEEALIDFKEAVEYYKQISADLASRFQVEFWSKIEELKTNPLQYQSRYRDIRLAHLKKFPYAIHFIMEDKRVVVFRILHHKQFYK
ncbi:hypothetical protein BST97_08525 [Nonlabens spongiae]|uniref:Plasmid stabilization system n=1 Tax=Nonlabens spongiae TaxID=331648 RepID=A0A1W6MKC1_9FLAO|nr:type II toxin-antitoxin system RelE/ParE family toxin [Nonlabens spongiae]ARN78040.1 hypothetical protein BST97_08525 [Nonlabens spongiae]